MTRSVIATLRALYPDNANLSPGRREPAQPEDLTPRLMTVHVCDRCHDWGEPEWPRLPLHPSFGTCDGCGRINTHRAYLVCGTLGSHRCIDCGVSSTCDEHGKLEGLYPR